MRQQVRSCLLMLSAGLLLLPTACFPPVMVSEPVSIAEPDRSIDPRLAGSYWRIEEGASSADFSVIEISVDRHRQYKVRSFSRTGALDSEADDDLARATFLKTDHPTIGLFLHTSGGKTSYVLAVHSRAGSLVIIPFIGDMRTRLGPDRSGYLNRVASRHGLTIKWAGDEDETVIGGKPDRKKIAALFSDPEFIGSLLLDPDEAITLLPANQAVPPKADRTAWWAASWTTRIQTTAFAMMRDERALLAPFSGEFITEGRKALVSRDEDGAYRVVYPDQAGLPSREPKRIHLLSIGGADRQLALIEERQWEPSPSERSHPIFTFHLANVDTDGAVRFSPLALVRHDLSAELDGIAQSLQAQAAARHGLSLRGNTLEGATSAAAIRSLFADPQFQVQLACQPVGVDLVFVKSAADRESPAEYGCRLRD